MRHLQLISLVTEHALEDGINMFGVVTKIEVLGDLFIRHGRRHVGVGEKLGLEIFAFFPDAHGVALDVFVSVLAADAFLSQCEQNTLGMNKAPELVEVVHHIFGVDDEFFDDAGQTGERKVERDGCVWCDAAFDGGMRNITFVPERDVFHRRDHGHADEAGKARQVLGQNRVALVRHGRRAFLALGEEFFGFKHFGALHVAYFNRDVFDRAGDDAECREEHGVTVAGDDLGRDRFGDEAKFFTDVGLNCGVDVREGSNRAGDGAGCNFCTCISEARKVAIHFRVEACERQAHGDGFGVNAVRATDADVHFVFVRARLQSGEEFHHIRDENIGGADKLDVQRGVEDVGRGHALVNEARFLVADDFGEVGEEGDDVVFGDGFDLVNAGDVEFNVFGFPGGFCAFAWDHTKVGLGVTGVRLDLVPDAELGFWGPDRDHVGAGVTGDHRVRAFRIACARPAFRLSDNKEQGAVDALYLRGCSFGCVAGGGG